MRLERRIGREAAGGRQHARLARRAAPRSARSIVRASIHATSSPCASQEARADLGRHELAGRHHARARAVAHLAHERDPGGDLAQLREVALDLNAAAECRARRRAAGGAPRWRAAPLSCACAEGGIEQLLQAIGDAGEGRVHDEHARAGGAPLGDDRARCCASWRARRRWCRRTSGRSRQRPCGSQTRFSGRQARGLRAAAVRTAASGPLCLSLE